MQHQNIAPVVERTLLDLFRRSLSSEPRAHASDLSSDNWLALGQLAKLHGIVPWMLKNLPAPDISYLPASLVSDWKAWEQKNRLRVLANWAVAIRVLAILGSAGVRALPIKGVVLSQQLYGSPWLRHAGDVDILIERGKVLDAHAAMSRSSLSPTDIYSNLSPNQWQWLLNNKYHTRYRDRGTGLWIESHWRLHGEGLLNNLDESWIKMAEFTPIDVLGQKVYTLPNPILYLLVMSHFARSRWSRLIWLLDSWKALEAIRTTHQKAELEACITMHGAERIHNQFLSMVRQLFEDDSLCQWPPPNVGLPVRQARLLGALRMDIRKIRLNLGMRGSLWYKLAVIKGLLIDVRDFAVIRLPDWLFWLYVPLRIPLHIYRRYWRNG